MKTSLAIALLALASAGGCSDRPVQAWSCNNPKRSACSQWSTSGTDAETTARQQRSCTEMGGTVVQRACSDDNVIGTCTSTGGDSRIVYYPPRTVPEAQQSCLTLGGSWK